jgi:sRNA-binding protein
METLMSLPHPRQQEAFALLNMLCESWPGAFRHDGEPPVPLQIGIREIVATELGGLVDKRVLKAALRFYTQRMPYRHCLIAHGATRHGLGGEPVGPVTPSEQEHAHEQIAAWRQKRSAPEPVPATIAKTDISLKTKGLAVRPNDGAKQGKSAGNPAPKGSKSKRLNAEPNGPAKPARKVSSSRAVPSTRNH